jgi:hypothetical protein
MRTSVVLALLWSGTAIAAPDAPSNEPAPAAPSPTEAPAPPSPTEAPAAPTEAPAAPGPTEAPTAQSTSAAPGAVAAGLSPIVVEDVPQPCRDLAKMASSPSKNAALSARISLATCLADQQAKALVLCDCEQSVIDVNDAIDPSLAMLDEVVAHGDVTMKILARHSQGHLLASFSARILATLPPPPTSNPDAIALRETRLAMLQPLIDPWQVRAHGAFAEVDKLARANPRLAKNAAVLAAVRSSRDRLSQVAKR